MFCVFRKVGMQVWFVGLVGGIIVEFFSAFGLLVFSRNLVDGRLLVQADYNVEHSVAPMTQKTHSSV